MKYQGFYDYSLDSSGNPDRTFTAKQFCMYLKGLLGNGIGITNATGDKAWKVEKKGDLTAKVALGNNGYNFASLEGNPFIVDEELSLIFSQGTDRWDSVMIRANSTMEVRATDVIIQENNINYIRNTDIYDLRLARVHIVNNVITEIIDDRMTDEYCGIADGLVKVSADELLTKLEEELAAVENGSVVALRNGILQEGLNSEMIGGKTIEELTDYYYVANIENKNTDFSSISDEIFDFYNKKYRTSATNETTEKDISTELTDTSTSTYISCNYSTGSDNNIIAKLEATGSHKIKISKWNYAFSGGYSSAGIITCKLQASNNNTTWTDLADISFNYSTSVITQGIKIIEDTNYYKYIRLICSDSKTGNYTGTLKVYTFDLEGTENSDILVVNMPINDVLKIKIPEEIQENQSIIKIKENNYLIHDLVSGANQKFEIKNGELFNYSSVISGSLSGSTEYNVNLGFCPTNVVILSGNVSSKVRNSTGFQIVAADTNVVNYLAIR